jgi:hypothetical protein
MSLCKQWMGRTDGLPMKSNGSNGGDLGPLFHREPSKTKPVGTSDVGHGTKSLRSSPLRGFANLSVINVFARVLAKPRKPFLSAAGISG